MFENQQNDLIVCKKEITYLQADVSPFKNRDHYHFSSWRIYISIVHIEQIPKYKLSTSTKTTIILFEQGKCFDTNESIIWHLRLPFIWKRHKSYNVHAYTAP